jgi:histone H3/H4
MLIEQQPDKIKFQKTFENRWDKSTTTILQPVNLLDFPPSIFEAPKETAPTKPRERKRVAVQPDAHSEADFGEVPPQEAMRRRRADGAGGESIVQGYWYQKVNNDDFIYYGENVVAGQQVQIEKTYKWEKSEHQFELLLINRATFVPLQDLDRIVVKIQEDQTKTNADKVELRFPKKATSLFFQKNDQGKWEKLDSVPRFEGNLKVLEKFPKGLLQSEPVLKNIWHTTVNGQDGFVVVKANKKNELEILKIFEWDEDRGKFVEQPHPPVDLKLDEKSDSYSPILLQVEQGITGKNAEKLRMKITRSHDSKDFQKIDGKWVLQYDNVQGNFTKTLSSFPKSILQILDEEEPAKEEEPAEAPEGPNYWYKEVDDKDVIYHVKLNAETNQKEVDTLYIWDASKNKFVESKISENLRFFDETSELVSPIVVRIQKGKTLINADKIALDLTKLNISLYFKKNAKSKKWEKSEEILLKEDDSKTVSKFPTMLLKTEKAASPDEPFLPEEKLGEQPTWLKPFDLHIFDERVKPFFFNKKPRANDWIKKETLDFLETKSKAIFDALKAEPLNRFSETWKKESYQPINVNILCQILSNMSSEGLLLYEFEFDKFLKQGAVYGKQNTFARMLQQKKKDPITPRVLFVPVFVDNPHPNHFVLLKLDLRDRNEPHLILFTTLPEVNYKQIIEKVKESVSNLKVNIQNVANEYNVLVPNQGVPLESTSTWFNKFLKQTEAERETSFKTLIKILNKPKDTPFMFYVIIGAREAPEAVVELDLIDREKPIVTFYSTSANFSYARLFNEYKKSFPNLEKGSPEFIVKKRTSQLIALLPKIPTTTNPFCGPLVVVYALYFANIPNLTPGTLKAKLEAAFKTRNRLRLFLAALALLQIDYAKAEQILELPQVSAAAPTLPKKKKTKVPAAAEEPGPAKKPRETKAPKPIVPSQQKTILPLFFEKDQDRYILRQNMVDKASEKSSEIYSLLKVLFKKRFNKDDSWDCKDSEYTNFQMRVLCAIFRKLFPDSVKVFHSDTVKAKTDEIKTEIRKGKDFYIVIEVPQPNKKTHYLLGYVKPQEKKMFVIPTTNDVTEDDFTTNESYRPLLKSLTELFGNNNNTQITDITIKVREKDKILENEFLVGEGENSSNFSGPLVLAMIMMRRNKIKTKKDLESTFGTRERLCAFLAAIALLQIDYNAAIELLAPEKALPKVPKVSRAPKVPRPLAPQPPAPNVFSIILQGQPTDRNWIKGDFVSNLYIKRRDIYATLERLNPKNWSCVQVYTDEHMRELCQIFSKMPGPDVKPLLLFNNIDPLIHKEFYLIVKVETPEEGPQYLLSYVNITDNANEFKVALPQGKTSQDFIDEYSECITDLERKLDLQQDSLNVSVLHQNNFSNEISGPLLFLQALYYMNGVNNLKGLGGVFRTNQHVCAFLAWLILYSLDYNQAKKYIPRPTKPREPKPRPPKPAAAKPLEAREPSASQISPKLGVYESDVIVEKQKFVKASERWGKLIKDKQYLYIRNVKDNKQLVLLNSYQTKHLEVDGKNLVNAFTMEGSYTILTPEDMGLWLGTKEYDAQNVNLLSYIIEGLNKYLSENYNRPKTKVVLTSAEANNIVGNSDNLENFDTILSTRLETTNENYLNDLTLFLPAHVRLSEKSGLRNHWGLLVVQFQTHTIRILDSKREGYTRTKIVNRYKKFIEGFKELFPIANQFPIAKQQSWKVKIESVPEQTGNDCGVYMMILAFLFVLGIKPTASKIRQYFLNKDDVPARSNVEPHEIQSLIGASIRRFLASVALSFLKEDYKVKLKKPAQPGAPQKRGAAVATGETLATVQTIREFYIQKHVFRKFVESILPTSNVKLQNLEAWDALQKATELHLLKLLEKTVRSIKHFRPNQKKLTISGRDIKLIIELLQHK